MSDKILCPISTLIKNLEIKAAKLTEQKPTAYFNCKDCYKAEYKRIMRETSLF